MAGMTGLEPAASAVTALYVSLNERRKIFCDSRKFSASAPDLREVERYYGVDEPDHRESSVLLLSGNRQGLVDHKSSKLQNLRVGAKRQAARYGQFCDAVDHGPGKQSHLR